MHKTYSSRIKHASPRHLTVAALCKRCRNSSQCITAANPPEEHPERRACKIVVHTHYCFPKEGPKRLACKIDTCSAFDKPNDKSSSITASQMSWPLKKGPNPFYEIEEQPMLN